MELEEGKSAQKLHIGMTCPPLAGHLKPALAIAEELLRRGHKVTHFGSARVEKDFAAIGAHFVPLKVEEHERHLEVLTESSFLRQMTAIPAFFRAVNEDNLNQLPGKLIEEEIDVLVCDEESFGAGTAAKLAERPHVTFTIASPLLRDSLRPPPLSLRMPPTSRLNLIATTANAVTWWALYCAIGGPILKRINEELKAQGKRQIRRLDDEISRSAYLAQVPEELDFPFFHRPPGLTYVGPCFPRSSGRTSPSMGESIPRRKLTGKPVVYATLGSVQSKNVNLIKTIATACEPLQVDLLIGLGGAISASSLPTLPGNAIALDFAPQEEALSMASATINHAGMNSVLEALRHAVPMVALPQHHDQPGTAARVAQQGAGKVIRRRSVTKRRLSRALAKVLFERKYRSNAARLRACLTGCSGASAAADSIESAVRFDAKRW